MSSRTRPYVTTVFKDLIEISRVANLNVRRTFHNVGQALFCIEQVGGFTIVYDCGGNNKEVVNAAIHRSFKANDTIDIVFLSHYDRDHVNGIFELLNLCNVSHLILPMVSNLRRFLSFEGMQDDSSDVELFCEDAEEYMNLHNLRTKVHYVTETEDDDEKRTINYENLPREIPSGAKIRKNDIDWTYVVYNRRLMNKDEEKRFLEALGLSSIATFASIKDAWKKVNLAIKKALEKINIIKIEDINDYSMTIYSGCSRNKCGCLYLGDYNALAYFEELFEAYKEVWPTIDIIQIPHHGSLKNFKEKLIVKGGCHVISNKEKPTSTTNVNSSEVECRIKRNGGVVVTTFDGDKTIRLVRDGVTLKNTVIG